MFSENISRAVVLVLSCLMDSGLIRDRSGGLLLLSNCLNNLGKLVSLCYVGSIQNLKLYKQSVVSVHENFRLSVLKHDTHLKTRFPTRKNVMQIYNTSKMHILCHLEEDIARFGSPVFCDTEKGEQYNKFIRETLFGTNRQQPSRDAATALGKRLISRHIFAGGSWIAADGCLPKAKPIVVNCVPSFRPIVRSFADNDDTNLKLQVGSTGVFRNGNGNLLIGEITKVHHASGRSAWIWQRAYDKIQDPRHKDKFSTSFLIICNQEAIYAFIKNIVSQKSNQITYPNDLP